MNYMATHDSIHDLGHGFESQYSALPLIGLIRANIKAITITDLFNLQMFFVYSLGTMGLAISDNNKRLIQLSVIQFSGGHCLIK